MCAYKDVNLIEGRLMPKYIHIPASLSPKRRESIFAEYLKGKSALTFFDKHPELKQNTAFGIMSAL